MKTMNYTHEDWATAPKDGSVSNVQFSDGTEARARWSSEGIPQWEVLRASGEWVAWRMTMVASSQAAGGTEPAASATQCGQGCRLGPIGIAKHFRFSQEPQ